MAVQLLYTSGTWQAPAGVTQVEVECWGGGGGTSQPSNNNARGGGGGGAYSKGIVSVVPGNYYDYVVGAAGTNSGSDGGDTYWINTSTILAKGGAGCTSDTGGSGGQSSLGVGSIKYSGGNGADKVSTNAGGGGGSAAGSTGNGNSASGSSGGSAVNEYGGAGGNGSVGTGVGGAGGDYGGGAGGSRRSGSILGAIGGPGLIRLTFVEPTFVEKTLAGSGYISSTIRKPVSKTLSYVLSVAATAKRHMTQALFAAADAASSFISNYDGYILQRKDGGGSYTDRARLTKGATEFTDCQGLTSDVTYCYRIKRIRFGLESAWSNEECILFSASTQYQKEILSGITITLAFDKRSSKTSTAGVRITRMAIKQVKSTKTKGVKSPAFVRRHMGKITSTISRIAVHIRKPVNKMLTKIIRTIAIFSRFTTRTFIKITKATGTDLKRTIRTFIKSIRSSAAGLRRTIKSLAGTIKAMGTTLRLNSLSKILNAVAITSAAFRRNTNRTLVEIVSISGSAVKRVVRTLVKHASAGGSTVKRSVKTLNETVKASGVFDRIKVYLKTLSAAVKGVSVFSRTAIKKLNTGIDLSVQMIKDSAQSLFVVISASSLFTMQTSKRVSDFIATASTVIRTKIAFKTLIATMRTVHTIGHAITKSIISGSVLMITARKRVSKSFTRTIKTIRSISKRTLKTFIKKINAIASILHVKAAIKSMTTVVGTIETASKKSSKALTDLIHLSTQAIRANAFYKTIIAVASTASSRVKETLKVITAKIRIAGFWIRVNLYYLFLSTGSRAVGSFNRTLFIRKLLIITSNVLGIGNKTREHLRITARNLTLETLQRELILEIEGAKIMAYIGDTIRLIGRFHDFSGDLADVDEVLVTIYDGKKNVLLIAVPDRQNTGIYTYDFTIPDCVSDPVVYEFSGVLEGSLILARSTIKRRWV